MVVLVLALAAIGHSTVVELRTIERSSTGSCHHLRPTGPGAGLAADGKTKPELALDRNLKDGFFHVACKFDEMAEMADKFGDNRHRYEDKHPHSAFGEVSIVRYADHVGREDQKAMTPQVCFDFCRTVPDMLFFGLRYGRECYCTPYFVANSAKGAGEVCDMPCLGDHNRVCGGLNRASLYEMHLCAETKKDIMSLVAEGEKLWAAAKPEAEAAVNLALTLEATANHLMRYSIGLGDMLSHANGQEAKVMAGKLKHAGEAAVVSASALRADLDALDGMKNNDFGYAEKAYEAEAQLGKTHASMQAVLNTQQSAADMDRMVHPDLPSHVTHVANTTTETFAGPKDFGAAYAACEAVSGNITLLGGCDAWPADGEDSWCLGNVSKSNYTCEFQVPNIGANTALGMFNSVLSSHDATAVSNVNTTLPTTCEGKYAGKPMTNLSLAECAEACVNNAPKSSIDYCVTFQYYEYDGSTSGPGAALKHSLCYLYREVGKVDYFEGEDCAADERLVTHPESFVERLTHRVRRHRHASQHRDHKRSLRGNGLAKSLAGSYSAAPPSRDDGPSDFKRVGCYNLLDAPPREAEFEKRPFCWGLKR